MKDDMVIFESVVRKAINMLKNVPGVRYDITYNGEEFTNRKPKLNTTGKFIDEISNMTPWEVRVVKVDGEDVARLQTLVSAAMNRLYGKGCFTTVLNRNKDRVEVMLHGEDEDSEEQQTGFLESNIEPAEERV